MVFLNKNLIVVGNLFYQKDKNLLTLISNKRNHIQIFYILRIEIQEYVKRYNINDIKCILNLNLVNDFLRYFDNINYYDSLVIEKDQNYIFNFSFNFLTKLNRF